jgi:hypothetical protein
LRAVTLDDRLDAAQAGLCRAWSTAGRAGPVLVHDTLKLVDVAAVPSGGEVHSLVRAVLESVVRD